MSVEVIKAKIEGIQQELHTEYQRGALQDAAKVFHLQQELNTLTQEVDDMNRASQHEAKIEESQSEIAYIMDTITVDGISMRELCAGEQAYQLLRAVIQETLLERDEKRLKEIKELETQLVTVKNDRDDTQKHYDELFELSLSLRSELNITKSELEDITHKRDASASELSESKAEVERLNSQVDDLRKEIAVGAANAYKVTDVNTSELVEAYKKQKQIEENAKPAIYDVQPLDNLKRRYTAKYAETDETLEFGFMEKGRYREVTAQEAETFRGAYEESQRANEDTGRDIVEEASELTPPTFQSEEVTADLVDVTDADRGVEDKTVEERLQAVEERSKALEIAVFGQVRDVA